MDSSRRAVEAYWRSKMIDGVTSDEDKVAPVYKLEEVCELLRNSNAGIVKEVSDYIFKRIDHKSPVVKQKALRLIKFAVVKSGVEFRREMQRHSAVIRELFHYKGHLDPLKGDALNKAVRETAHEAMSSIFSDSNDNKTPAIESFGNRIQGFGNENYEMRVEEKKSFISEVVDIGRASIEQGLSSLASAHSGKKSDNGSYRSPNLTHSLTSERVGRNRYEGNSKESWNNVEVPKDMGSRNWVHNSADNLTTVGANGDAGQSVSGIKSREERLLETIVTSGGVRLQPTRDAVRIFLSEASKLNLVSMCHAIESKLQSNLWQVRMKALCVLEAMLRKKDDEQFAVVSSYFSENRDHIVKCSESPQVSLREKGTKVLNLLEGDTTAGINNSQSGESSTGKNTLTPSVPLPDLIDTDYLDGSISEDPTQKQTYEIPKDLMSTGSLVDDLFGNEPITGTEPSSKTEGDPFADVSFHTSEGAEHVDDLFSGLTIGERRPIDEVNMVTSNQKPWLPDLFGSESKQASMNTVDQKLEMHDLMADLSIDRITSENKQPGGTSGAAFLGATSTFNTMQHQPNINDILNLSPQMVVANPSLYSPMTSVYHNFPPTMMPNSSFPSQPVNYSATGNLFPQQQLQFQNLGNTGISYGFSNPTVENSLPLPEIFNPSNSTIQNLSTMMSSPKKEETKAFDFISDHLSSARNSKRVI